MTTKQRYDIVYDQSGPYLAHHYCREWDHEGGCYGTNPNHGMLFEEAKKHMVEHHRQEMEAWEKMTEEEFNKQNYFFHKEDDV